MLFTPPSRQQQQPYNTVSAITIPSIICNSSFTKDIHIYAYTSTVQKISICKNMQTLYFSTRVASLSRLPAQYALQSFVYISLRRKEAKRPRTPCAQPTKTLSNLDHNNTKKHIHTHLIYNSNPCMRFQKKRRERIFRTQTSL